MEGSDRPSMPEEMQELLRQMQRTTSLLAQRLLNTSPSSAPPLASHSSSSAPPPASQSSSSAPPPASQSSSSALPSSSFSVWPHHSSTSLPPPPCLASSSAARHSQANIQANLARLFGPYEASSRWGKRSLKRKREVPWTHTFVCLPEPGAEVVPNPEECHFFEQCGIGRKTITFTDNMGDHQHLSDVLYSTYPPLRGAGGYVLAKSDRSKKLHGIPIPPSGYSIEYLRRSIDIKRAPLYVIPLQRSLTLHPPVVEAPTVMETCLVCSKDVPLCSLARHLTSCTNNDECEEMTSHHSADSNEDEDLAQAIYESLQPSMPVEVTAEEQPRATTSDQGNTPETVSEPIIVLSGGELSEDDVASEPDVVSVLQQLSSQLHDGVPPPSNSVNVMRDSVLESALRAFARQRFSPAHRLNIVFVDGDGITEGAVDDGGPTREFLRLLVLAVKDSIYFTGQDYGKNLSLVSRAVDNRVYRHLGKMVSVALVHGGVRPSFFSERLYSRVSHPPTPTVSMEEVDDCEVREKLQRIKDTETLQDARGAVMDASGLLGLLGCPGFLHTLEQKHDLVEEAERAYVEGRTQKALQQLVDGLKTLGVAEAIEKDPEVLKPLFVGGPKALDVQDMMDLFEPCFSPPGSNRRRQENQALMFWKDWLIELDEGTRPVTLQKMLIFASGTDNIPPLGFRTRPKIEFLHQNDGNLRIFPEANTCEVILRLPLHPSYSAFVDHRESGILQSPTFGLI